MHLAVSTIVALKITVRLAMLYEVKYCVMKLAHKQRTRVVETRILRWVFEHTGIDKIRNENIKDKVRSVLIEGKLQETHLR